MNFCFTATNTAVPYSLVNKNQSTTSQGTGLNNNESSSSNSNDSSNANSILSALSVAGEVISDDIIKYGDIFNRSKLNAYRDQLRSMNQSIWNGRFNSNSDILQQYQTNDLSLPVFDYGEKTLGQHILYNFSQGIKGAGMGMTIGGPWGALIGAAAAQIDAGIQSGLEASQAKKQKRLASNFYDNALVNRTSALGWATDRVNQNNNLLQEFNYSDLGGPLNHGTEWNDNVILVDNGGTHEENPYGGVLMGVDAEGIPNLVEEGEVIWNDYVFSNRLNIPMSIRKKYNLKKNGGSLTYADAIKGSKQFKALEEMPNDKITKDSFETFIADLAMSQEEERAKDRAKRSNRFDWGGFMNALKKYTYSTQKGGKNGTYKIDPNMHKSLGFNTIKELENSDQYKAFTKFILDNPNNADVQEYLKTLDSGTHKDVEKLFDSEGNLKSNWKTLYENRRNDGKGGIYHFSGSNPNEFRGLTDVRINNDLKTSDIESVPVTITDKDIYGDLDAEVAGLEIDPELLKAKPRKTMGAASALRYAPVFGNLSAMLGTLATPVDYSNIERYENFGLNAPIVPTHPIGNYTEYRPFDINYAANRLGAKAANRRRLLSDLSGGNAATARANIIVSDYDEQNDIGDLLIAAADSNLKQRLARDSFNRETNKFNSTDAARADAANVGIWNSKLQTLMRGASEREAIDARRSAALSQNMTALSDNLGNIGREEFIFNQLDANPALLYKYLDKNGRFGYTGSKGGLLTVKKIRRK